MYSPFLVHQKADPGRGPFPDPPPEPRAPPGTPDPQPVSLSGSLCCVPGDRELLDTDYSLRFPHVFRFRVDIEIIYSIFDLASPFGPMVVSTV